MALCLFALCLEATAAAGALGAQDAQEVELNGLVLSMEDITTASQLPGESSLSGTRAGDITLDGATLVNQKGSSTAIEAQCGTFYYGPSAYKKSYYSPDVDLASVNNSWTWRLTFTVSADIELTQTQVAFFSCDKTSLATTSKEADFGISYAMEIGCGGSAIAATNGEATLSGAQNAADTGYDFRTGQITAGSGAIVADSWSAPVLLQTGNTYTFSLRLSYKDQASTSSTGVGFGGIWFVEQASASATSAPEPATGALSLLALAIFISRRRRA